MVFWFFSSKIVTYCLLGNPDQFQSTSLPQKYCKIIHDSQWHFDWLSQKVKVSNSQKSGKVFSILGIFKPELSREYISYWLWQLGMFFPFLAPVLLRGRCKEWGQEGTASASLGSSCTGDLSLSTAPPLGLFLPGRLHVCCSQAVPSNRFHYRWVSAPASRNRTTPTLPGGADSPTQLMSCTPGCSDKATGPPGDADAGCSLSWALLILLRIQTHKCRVIHTML